MEFFLRVLAGSLNADELALLIAEQRRKRPAPAFNAAAGALSTRSISHGAAT